MSAIISKEDETNSDEDSKEEKEETDQELANRLNKIRMFNKPFRSDHCCFVYCRPGRELRLAEVKEFNLDCIKWRPRLTEPCKKMSKALDLYKRAVKQK